MKVLLVSIDAKYIHTNNAVRLLEANSSYPIITIEKTIKDSAETILNEIRQNNPDIVGFSVYIWNVNLIKEILHNLNNQPFEVILGGPEVSYEPEEFLRIPSVNLIVRGEGEIVFDEIIKRKLGKEKRIISSRSIRAGISLYFT